MCIQSKHLKAVLLFFLATFTLAVFAEPVFARRRSRRNNSAAIKARKESMIKAAQSQYAAAQQVLASAQSGGSVATGRLQAVVAEMTSAADALREARAESLSLTKDLAEIEEDILDEQSVDTPYAQLMEEMRKTKRDLATAESRVTTAASFVSEFGRLKTEKGTAAALAFRQLTLQSDAEHTAAKGVLLGQVDKQAKLKRELFAKDSEWQNTHEMLLESHKAENSANADVYSHAPERAGPKRDIKDARQLAAAAQTAMAEAEQVLRGLGSKPKTSSSLKK